MVRIAKTFARPARQALQRRLAILSAESESKRTNAAVRRVLDLLSDENLSEVAARSGGKDRIPLECAIIGDAWDDPRIANRINQLARQGIEVEREVVTTSYGDAAMRRERLVVRF